MSRYLKREELIVVLKADIALNQISPHGCNGNENTSFLNGINRGLEIALRYAERDLSVDPKEECDKLLKEINHG